MRQRGRLTPTEIEHRFFSYSQGGAYPHTADNELKPIEINLVWASFVGLAVTALIVWITEYYTGTAGAHSCHCIRTRGNAARNGM